MSVEYARRGLAGVLVPQANTTVEPEFAILLPPGLATVTARMVSAAPDMHSRLVDYFARLPDWVSQFANAPIGAIAIACTGASYLVGAEREQLLIDEVARQAGVPVVTSGRAVVAALQAVGARRVAFVSPYPRALTETSLRYWAEFGFETARVVEVGAVADRFHPIYAMEAANATAALDGLAGETGLDAVVMLGTGMPTLAPVLARPRAGGAPVLSCMLATAWRMMQAMDGTAPSAASLLAWIDTPAWAVRFHDWMGDSLPP